MPDDCTTCGACCFSNLEPYVPVTGDDHQRLGDAAQRYVVFDGNKAFMRMEAGRCAALRLEGARFLCAFYERRPATCRDLERGSAQCAGELLAKGDRPRAAQAIAAPPRPCDDCDDRPAETAVGKATSTEERALRPGFPRG